MKNNEDDKLWQDILSEVAPQEFQDALLSQTLARARRQKQMRRFSKAVMVVAVVAGVSFLFWRGDADKRIEPAKIARSTVEEISSKPLAQEMIVRSTSGAVQIVSSQPAGMILVGTEQRRKEFREINDEELMSLTEGRPAALVRTGPHQAELLLVDIGGKGITAAGEQSIQQ